MTRIRARRIQIAAMTWCSIIALTRLGIAVAASMSR
jgi:hypothetical protein